ncbi:MAG: hypothetical protein P4L20_02130 [Acidimicrobiales bacterium]|nr:hypothetical protein [Acidimicrobiales bacterium]
MASALEPVSEALVEKARLGAEQQLADASEDVRVELSRAHAEARRLLAEARAQGASAAESVASLQLVEARRDAREMVLRARRRAYEALRHDAIGALERRAKTTEGRMLIDQLSALVEECLGGDAPIDRAEHGALVVEARSGNRRVAIGPTMLIDHVLLSMAEQVEGLWA